MGGRGSGQRGTAYFWNEGQKRKPPVTWQNKELHEMDAKDIANARRYLVEGWISALPPSLLYPHCGLCQEQIDELIRRDPHLADFRDGAAERLVARARVNVAQKILEGDVKQSQYLLDRVDPEFQPASKLTAGVQKVEVPVEEKQEKFISELKNIVDNVEVEFSDESTDGTSE